MTSILIINSYMDNGTHMGAVDPLGTNGLHHLRIAHTDDVVAHSCTNALTSYLFYVAHLATIGSLVGESIAQGSTNGVGREVLYVGCQVEQPVFRIGCCMAAFMISIVAGVYGSYCKLSTGQRARLVEDHRVDLGQHIHIGGTLDEDAATRGSANAAEEGQRNADDQGAGTADYQKCEGAVEPDREGLGKRHLVGEE